MNQSKQLSATSQSGRAPNTVDTPTWNKYGTQKEVNSLNNAGELIGSGF